MSKQPAFGCERPRWSLTRWLVEPGRDIPDGIRLTLLQSLYSTLPIFVGGVLNTIAVSALIAMRLQTAWAYLWVGIEILLAVLRLPLLIVGRRQVSRGKPILTDLYILLAVAWAASVGYGAFITIMSGDWVASTLTALSAAAMVGGICLRNFGAPRLVAVMIALSLGPCAIAAAMSGHNILLLVMFEIPLYLISMSAAAFQLKRLLVRTMQAELQNDHHARHDPLTGLLNRGGLARWMENRPANNNAPLAAFYLDLDWFKTINDSLGHKAGDEVLIGVATRLRDLLGDGAQIVRLGGDEFVVIVEDIGRTEAEQLADTIKTVVANDGYDVLGQTAFIGISVGLAYSLDYGDDISVLLNAADVNLYDVKSKNHFAETTKKNRQKATTSTSVQRARMPRYRTNGPSDSVGSLAAARRVRRRLSTQLGRSR